MPELEARHDAIEGANALCWNPPCARRNGVHRAVRRRAMDQAAGSVPSVGARSTAAVPPGRAEPRRSGRE